MEPSDLVEQEEGRESRGDEPEPLLPDGPYSPQPQTQIPAPEGLFRQVPPLTWKTKVLFIRHTHHSVTAANHLPAQDLLLLQRL